MSQLEELVRFEGAHSGLAFREHAYAPGQQAELVRDVLALANAAVDGPRFLFLGVRDCAPNERSVPGISERAWSECKRLLPRVAGLFDPPLKIAVRALHVDHALVGMLCLTRCEEPPYLVGENGGVGLSPGAGWIRRGARRYPLLRRDLQRMFEARLARSGPAIEPRVGFAGDEAPCGEITLQVLPLDELPSVVAADKVRRLLEVKYNAREFGQTTTRITRLVHAQLFGADETYEAHSDDSLRRRMAQAAEEYEAADGYYQFEQRAHPLEIVIENPAERALHGVSLRLKLARIEGIGVAERPYGPAGEEPDAHGYPLVSTGARTIGIQADVGDVAPSARVSAFGRPPRLWIREAAAGTTIPLDYTLHARELHEPLRDVLLIRIEA